MKGDYPFTHSSFVSSHAPVQSWHICCLNHKGAYSLQENNQKISYYISAKVHKGDRPENFWVYFQIAILPKWKFSHNTN